MSTLSRWRTRLAALLAAGSSVAFVGCDAPERADGDNDRPSEAEATDAELLAYGIGYYLGEEVRAGLDADGIEIDLAVLREGFRHGYTGATTRWSEDEVEAVLIAVHAEMEKRTVERWLREDPSFRQLHDENLERSRAYLAENVQKPGVKQLEGGIQYEVLSAGGGTSPTLADDVIVSYRASFVDGDEISASDRHVVEMEDAVPGVQAIMLAMGVGDHWRVVVPPELAYGPAGDPPRIGPNEAIVLDVEVLEIQ